MELPLLSKVYVRGGRPVLRWLFRQTWLRRRLLAERDADLKKGLDHDIAWMLALAERTGDDELATGTPAAARRRMAQSILLVDDPPEGAVTATDRTVEGADGPIPARVYVPAGLPSPSPGLVFVHGGGWVTGDLDTHDALCRRFALLGKLRVVAVAPRMAPEHRYPAAAEDTIAAFRSVARGAKELGIDPARLGIAGDSAGGNLSAVVGLATRDDEVKPALTVLIYPGLDMTCSQPSHRELGEGYFLTRESIDWYLGHYVEPARRREPHASPLLCEDVGGAPRALIANAGFDPLRDEAERYAERLEAVGTKVDFLRSPSLPHGFALMTGICPAALAATEAIIQKTGDILGS